MTARRESLSEPVSGLRGDGGSTSSCPHQKDERYVPSGVDIAIDMSTLRSWSCDDTTFIDGCTQGPLARDQNVKEGRP